MHIHQCSSKIDLMYIFSDVHEMYVKFLADIARVSSRCKAPPCSSPPSPTLPRSSPSESPLPCFWRARLSRTLNAPVCATAPTHYLFKIVFVPSPSFLCLATLQPKTDCFPTSFFCVLSFRFIFTQSHSIFDTPLPSLSLFVQSLSSPAPSILPPLSPLAARSAGAPPSLLATNLLLSASTGVPVLNVDAVSQPLTFRSAFAGPFRRQWIESDDD